MVLVKVLGNPTAQHLGAQPCPRGPALSSDVVSRLTTLEVWGAWEEVNDFLEYRAYAHADLLAVVRVPYFEPSLAAVRQGAHRP